MKRILPLAVSRFCYPPTCCGAEIRTGSKGSGSPRVGWCARFREGQAVDHGAGRDGLDRGYENGRAICGTILGNYDNVTRKGNEQGLLGLAFAPDFDKSGTTISTTTKRVVTRASSVTSPKMVLLLILIAEKSSLNTSSHFGNHNGGWLDFGPDGMLCIATGDGGSANDPKARAQDTVTQYLGKVLRLGCLRLHGYKIPGTTIPGCQR